MAKWRVEFFGAIGIEADSAFEAELRAASEVGSSGFHATLIEGDENNILYEEEEEG